MTLKPNNTAASGIEFETQGKAGDARDDVTLETEVRQREMGRLEAVGREATELFQAFARFHEARREIIVKTVARYWLAKALRRQMVNGCEDLASQILRTEAGKVMVRVEELLLRLDAVESHNDETLRFLRKQLVTRLNQQLGEMESFMMKLKRLVVFQTEKDAAARDLLNRNSPKKKPLMSANEAVALGVEEILGSAGLLPPPLRALVSGASQGTTETAPTSSLASSHEDKSPEEPFQTPSAHQREVFERGSPTSKSPTTTKSPSRSVSSPSSQQRRLSRASEEDEEETLKEPEYTVQDRKHAVVITVRDEEVRRCEIEIRGRDGNSLSVRVPGRRRVQFTLDPERLNVRQATKELLGYNVLQIVLPKRRLAAPIPSYDDDAAFRNFFLRGWPRF